MTNKIKLIIIFFLLLSSSAWCQSPNMINYQGVAINSSGSPIANQTIAIRASIHQATANGTILYSEERNTTTDDGGLFNIQIGSAGATATLGTWSAITWSNAAKFLQVEMDPTGGTSYVNMGTQQLVSVPYAQYANLSGALIPTATINPNQINAGGASANQVLKFDGANWVPGTDVSAFALPYTGTDASAQSFKITNSNATSGTAISGFATGSGSISRGILGSASGTNGSGVYGTATGANGAGVEGYTNAIGAKAIKGNHAANGVAIEGTTGTGTALRGECTGASGTAVYGLSSGASGIAIHGESVNGTGVKGYGNNAGSVAVSGSSLAGTGVYATSFTGTALSVNGNVKITGGNTNPSDGAVLTSDASGNAVWQNNKIGFSARGAVNTSIPHNTYRKVEFSTEDYDLQSNYQLYTGSTTPSTSVFTAPVAGVYHFSSAVKVWMSSATQNITHGELIIMKNGGAYAYAQGTPLNSLMSSDLYLDVEADIHLNANDKIWVEVLQLNGSSTALGLINGIISGRFNGHLVFAD